MLERLLFENGFSPEAVDLVGMTTEEIEIALATETYSEGEHRYRSAIITYPGDIWIRRSFYDQYDRRS